MVQILVIDDEEPIRKLLARIIELEGYKVSTTSPRGMITVKLSLR